MAGFDRMPCLTALASARQSAFFTEAFPLIKHFPLVSSSESGQSANNFIMNGVENKKKPGSGKFNANKPFGNNPWIAIPADVDRNPIRLVWMDIISVFKLIRLLPHIVTPLRPCISGSLDELSGTLANTRDLLLHTVLVISQLALIITLPILTVLFWFVPGIVHLVFISTFTASTLLVMRLLNGGPRAECLVGLPVDRPPVNDEQELWFFINGIATGYMFPNLSNKMG